MDLMELFYFIYMDEQEKKKFSANANLNKMMATQKQGIDFPALYNSIYFA